MIQELADRMSFDSADDANIPVDIWLHAPDEECPSWRLLAANYMPRKGCLHPHGYEVRADNREELNAIVRDKILPLYRVATAQLEAIANGEADHLYYWQFSGAAAPVDAAPADPALVERLQVVTKALTAAGWIVSQRDVDEALMPVLRRLHSERVDELEAENMRLNIEVGEFIAAKNATDIALAALYAAARTDEHSQWWPIRKWMDDRGIFNADIEGFQRLAEIVIKHLVGPDAIAALSRPSPPSAPNSAKITGPDDVGSVDTGPSPGRG
jgi:hypothetical protein